MKKRRNKSNLDKNFIYLIVGLLLILFTPFISTNFYHLELNQVDNKVVIKENVNGINSSYVSNEAIEKTSKGYVFLESIILKEDFDKIKIILNLDQGFIIKNSEIYPKNYLLETDGNSIQIIWEFDNLKKEEEIILFAVLENLNEKSIWTDLLVVFGILASIIYLLFYFSKKRASKENKTDKYLLDIEKQVLNELRKAENQELWQKNIQKNLNLSKAKTSRIIRNLEFRGLVKKIPFGNTNKITLN